MLNQPGSSEPVAYDPCRPIHVTVNNAAAPRGSDGIVSEALDVIADATGLTLISDKATSEEWDDDRPPFQPSRYGDRWAPVLIAWSNPHDVPGLAGQVAGLGGSTPIAPHPDAPLVYVTGAVALDSPQLAEILQRQDGRKAALAVVIHELAHVVGLTHVDDTTQLMDSHGHQGVTRPQRGDRAGLARLGTGRCIPSL